MLLQNKPKRSSWRALNVDPTSSRSEGSSWPSVVPMARLLEHAAKAGRLDPGACEQGRP